MIDHITIPVSNLTLSQTFYHTVLGVFDYQLLYSDAEVAGFGVHHWIFGVEQSKDAINPLHIALKATDKIQVDTFYQTALTAGGKDNGAPGTRSEYGDGYYAAFVLDADGHNIEAVFRG